MPAEKQEQEQEQKPVAVASVMRVRYCVLTLELEPSDGKAWPPWRGLPVSRVVARQAASSTA